MKKNIFLQALVASAFLYSCNDGNNKETTMKDSTTNTMVSTDTSNKMSPDNKMNSDNNMPADSATVKFVNNAAIAGMMEIELGNIAKSKTKNQRINDYADMLVRDHTAAAGELKITAASNNIKVPDELPADKKDHIEMMKKKSGTEFDKAYMDMMVNDHKKVIDDFKSASKDLKNNSIKDFATRTLPTLEKHLDSAKAISNKKM